MGCCSKKKTNDNNNNVYLLQEQKENPSLFNDEQIQVNSNPQIQQVEKKLCYEDFEPLKLLGTGSFGKVILVRKKNNKKLYAMKILLKSVLKESNQEEHTKAERDLMVSLNFPFIVDIKYAFQDKMQLYLVTEFMQGGDMFFHLQLNKKFERESVKFYIIELVLAIEHLHQHNMIYRDLKLENILLDKYGHIKIIDFGLSKQLTDINNKAFTLCGTPEYLAPEVLYNKGYDKGVDWWSLGCVFYILLTGCLPFHIPRGKPLNPKMFATPIKFPKESDKDEIDLISKLLTADPKQRIGNGPNDAKEIKNHPYFKNVDWNKYLKKEINPPFKPELDDELDLKYFDKTFTEESINVKQQLGRSIPQSDFFGFTYNDNSFKKELEYLNTNDRENIKEEIDE